MLKDLIARIFCREIRRKLSRLGILGAIVSACFAFYVELPLEISIATREAQAAMVSIERSIERTLAQSERHLLEVHHLQMIQAKRDR